MLELCQRTVSAAAAISLVAGISVVGIAAAPAALAAGECPANWTFDAASATCSRTWSSASALTDSWQVPAGITSIHVDVNGAKGGRGGRNSTYYGDSNRGAPGPVGRVYGTLTVTPGSQLGVYVGGVGGDGETGCGSLGYCTAGENGQGGPGGTNALGGYAGGRGANQAPNDWSGGGGGGGAATVITVGGVATVVAAGGGGGGGGAAYGNGGAGDTGRYITGTNGSAGISGSGDGGGGGGGGGGTQGGAGGSTGSGDWSGTGGSSGANLTPSGLTSTTLSAATGEVTISYYIKPINSAVPTVPASTSAPTAAGGAAGTWAGANSFAYQWLRCSGAGTATSSIPQDCQVITGATALSYVPTLDDLGSHLRLAVTATNSAGSTTAISATSNAVTLAAPSVDLVAGSDTGVSSTDNLTQDTSPTYTISGLVIDDSYLVTATKGSETVTLGPFAATQSTETHAFPQLADGVWSVTAVQTYGAFTSPSSAPVVTTIDSAAPLPPDGLTLAAASDTGANSSDRVTKDTTPTIDLTGLEVGNKVVVTASKPGAPDVTCVIANATSTSESCTFATPLGSDGEWSFSAVQVDDAGNTSGASSPMTMQLDTSAGVALTSAPTPTGTSATAATSFTFTATLTDAPAGATSFTSSDITLAGTSTGWAVDPASWTQVSPTQYTFVVSATTPTQGTLIVKVPAGSYDDTAGNTATATVSPDWTSTIVVQPPTNTAPPTLSATSGTTTTLGSTLSSTPGTWNDQGDINPTTTYRWQVCPDNTGTGCTDIPGATSSTYVPVAAQENLYIRSVVTRTNVKGSTEQASALVGPMTKSPQDIDFANPGTKTYSPTPFTVAPRSEFVGSSNLTGLTVQMTSLTPDVCSVTGFSVAMLKSGTCTLAANQPGNGEFQPATQVTQSFTINRANDSSVTTPSGSVMEPGQTVTLTTANNTTGDDTYTVVSGPCTVAGNIVTSTGTTGDCVIATSSAQDDRYNASTAPSITIAVRSTDVINLPTIDDTLSTSGSFSYVGSALSGRTPSLSVGPAGVCTYAAGAITVVGPGTCTVTATLADNGSWSAATSSESFAVVAPPTPATINSVKTGAGDGVLGGSAQVFFTPGPSNGSVVTNYTVSATPAGGGTPVSVTCSVSPCTVPGLSAGDYDFTVTTNATAVGTPVTATSGAQRATVLAAHPIVLANPGPQRTTTESLVITATSGVDDSWIPTVTSTTPSVCTVVGFTVTIVGPGTCTLEASHVGGSHAGTTYGMGWTSVSFSISRPRPAPNPSPTPTPTPSDPEPPVNPCPASAADCDCPCSPEDPTDPDPDDPEKPVQPEKPVKPGDMLPPPPPSDVKVTPGDDGDKSLVRITLPPTRDNRAIESVVIVVLDAEGNIVRRVTVDVTDGDRNIAKRVAIPEGGSVRVYTINSAGVSNRAPAGANVIEHESVIGKRDDGRPILYGKKITKPVFFGPDSPALDARARQILDDVARYVGKHGGTVYITGFVRKGQGSEKFRQQLSSARALQVAEYLSALGVDTWIRYDGAGAYREIDPRVSDRRVEIRWAKSGIPGGTERGQAP